MEKIYEIPNFDGWWWLSCLLVKQKPSYITHKNKVHQDIPRLLLVGGDLTILKNDGVKVNGKDDPIYYGKIKCSKPPTSIGMQISIIPEIFSLFFAMN